MLHDKELLEALLKKPSITPNDSGCTQLISQFFQHEPLDFSIEDTSNAYFEFGQEGPLLLFVGHTDVVPTGPIDNWSSPPFPKTLGSDPFIARGIVDMKGAIWAFCSALKSTTINNGRVGILLTSDEEGHGKNGLNPVIKSLAEQNFKADWAIVGEPTSLDKVGDTYKHKRRGSYTLKAIIRGIQGHTAYPQYAKNPSKTLTTLLQKLEQVKEKIDSNTDIEIFSIESSTHTGNIVPEAITIGINIRYHDTKTITQVESLLKTHADEIIHSPGAKPYQSNPTVLKKALLNAIDAATGITSTASILGGTSDARFLEPIAIEIIEFGLRSKYAHKIDEQCTEKDLINLRKIYQNLIQNIFT